ncbi:HNH endonuclease signature motif containing protein [Acinetobacter sp.]|uniref:HNH endonuclease signature motif containing protein n=1 Tax=Acinetobacter sp. TaxID=472 RepID=UPI0038910663
MNYRNVYEALVASALSQDRSKSSIVYLEEHHIIPKCLGGLDIPENLVLLTPREHFIAHVLPWKDNPIRKLCDPILFFKKKDGKIATSKLYEMARRAHIDEMRNNNPSLSLSEASRLSKSIKLSEYAKNRKPSHNKKISEANTGAQSRLNAILSAETKTKIGSSLDEYFSQNDVSKETKQKITDGLNEYYRNNKVSNEIKQNLTLKALARQKWACPFCSKMYDGGNLTQHIRRKHDWSDEQIKTLKVF